MPLKTSLDQKSLFLRRGYNYITFILDLYCILIPLSIIGQIHVDLEVIGPSEFGRRHMNARMRLGSVFAKLKQSELAIEEYKNREDKTRRSGNSF